MIGVLRRLFAPAEPALSPARPADAAQLAALHEQSFRGGWSAEEFERLLADRSVTAHRAMAGRRLVGVIISRGAVDEAEILSVAVAASARRRGTARRLLNMHMGRLTANGVQRLLLEVDEGNAAARHLYARAGFYEVGRRQGYYQRDSGGGAALVLCRDLV
jgi:[ribosomal protein S18]-alanine N-acetyltransferase